MIPHTKCRSNIFFAVFFCYPTICVISFAAFICKQMNPDDSVLEMDDAVMCEDPGHRAMQWASLAVIIVVAATIPTATMRAHTTRPPMHSLTSAEAEPKGSEARLIENCA